MGKNWKDFIIRAKEEYRRIGSISCSAFGGELIYFNKHGLRHLIIKNGIPRPIAARLYKFKLIKSAAAVITKAATFNSYEIHKNTDGTFAELWSLQEMVGASLIKVIVRGINGGRKHFLSVMEIKLPKRAQAQKGLP